MRELRSWGVFLLPNADFFSQSFCKGFRRQMQMGSRRGSGGIEGECDWEGTLFLTPTKASCAWRGQQQQRLLCCPPSPALWF